MPAKIFHIQGIGDVSMYKRHGVRGVKLSITHDGVVRVTLPTWAPYKLGTEFVKTKSDWILSRQRPVVVLRGGDRIGKAHRITLNQTNQARTASARLVGTDIRVTYPRTENADDISIQTIISKAAIRALKKESEQLLPKRLQALAEKEGFTYTSVSIKRLKSRWGSCNERQAIVLNCFLIQLPWHLIDYVLLHELVHTRVLRHGKPFWTELAKYVKDLPALRREMKDYYPSLITVPSIERYSQGMQQIEIL